MADRLSGVSVRSADRATGQDSGAASSSRTADRNPEPGRSSSTSSAPDRNRPLTNADLGLVDQDEAGQETTRARARHAAASLGVLALLVGAAILLTR